MPISEEDPERVRIVDGDVLPFRGHDVSLNSVSDLIVKLAVTPGMEVRRSVGVSRG